MINRFLEYIAVEKKYSPRTVDTYRDDLYGFCRFLGVKPEELDPKAIDESDVKTWIVDMLEKDNYSKRTVKQCLSALKSFYKFLLRVKVVDRDITRLIEAPKVDKPLPVFFKPSEMQEALQYEAQADDLTSVRDCLIIEMLYQTGMRRAEMLGLQDSDIDLTTGQIRVFGKRRKERIIPIGERLIELIRNYIALRGDYAPAFFIKQRRDGTIAPLDKTMLYHIVCSRMGEVSTLRKHSPHVLRHTFATTMLDNGADIRTIQQLLGHASLAATQVYTHTTFEQIRNTYNHAHPRATKVK